RSPLSAGGVVLGRAGGRRVRGAGERPGRDRVLRRFQRQEQAVASPRARACFLPRVRPAGQDGRGTFGGHGGGHRQRGPRVRGGGPMSAENGRAGAERAMENGAAQAAPWWERRAEDVERLIGKYPNSRSAIMRSEEH